MSNIRDQFGKPREGGSLNIISLKEGESKTLRLLPPMKSCIAKGQTGAYHKQHYGYEVSNPRDPTKTLARPFLCVEVRDGNDLTVVSCPECRKVEEVNQKLKDDMAKEMASGVSESQAKVKFDETYKWLQSHNLDKKWYIPVMLEDGNFGILKVPHAAKKAIDKARKQLKESEGLDLYDIDNGAWVKLSRTGTGRTTEYDAVVIKETRVLEGGTRATVTKTAPLSDDQLQAALELPDVLTSPLLVRSITKEQIQMLANGGGSTAEVEAILNLSTRVESTEVRSTPPPARQALPTQAVPVATKPSPTPVVEEDPDEKALRELQAKMAAKKAGHAAVKQLSAPTVSALDPDISDEEFAARFPPPQR